MQEHVSSVCLSSYWFACRFLSPPGFACHTKSEAKFRSTYFRVSVQAGACAHKLDCVVSFQLASGSIATADASCKYTVNVVQAIECRSVRLSCLLVTKPVTATHGHVLSLFFFSLFAFLGVCVRLYCKIVKFLLCDEHNRRAEHRLRDLGLFFCISAVGACVRKGRKEWSVGKFSSWLSICQARFLHHFITTPRGHLRLSFNFTHETYARELQWR